MYKDQVFVINLKKSTTRREEIQEEFHSKGVNFTFFDAIDGRETNHFIYDDYNYPKRLWLTSGKPPSPGELGCYASHYLLWLKCIELNQPIIVCEDDIQLNDNAESIIQTTFERIHEFGFLRLEPLVDFRPSESHVIEANIDCQIRLMKNNFGGARSYAISPAAASKLIKHAWCFPVDCFIGAHYLHHQFSYQLSPTLITEELGIHETTIQNNAEPELNRTPIYRKITREIYTLYKKIRLNMRYQNELKKMDLKIND